MELGALLAQEPQIALSHAEMLAELHVRDPLLDRLRHELLNLAASGSRLESERLKDHLVRSGMAGVLERLGAPQTTAGRADEEPDAANREKGEELDARFLRAAAQLQEMAELVPERKRAVERFNSEATEENWRDAQRLIAPRAAPNE
jgi:DNA primase